MHAGNRPRELTDHLRDEDLTSVRLGHHARAGVDRGAERRPVALEDLADVEADPHAERLLRPLAFAFRERLLHGGRPGDRCARRCKRDHHRVADRVDLAAAVRLRPLAHHPLRLRQYLLRDRVPGARAQCRRPLDVDVHDRHETVGVHASLLAGGPAPSAPVSFFTCISNETRT
jgi:hypothetical protein